MIKITNLNDLIAYYDDRNDQNGKLDLRGLDFSSALIDGRELISKRVSVDGVSTKQVLSQKAILGFSVLVNLRNAIFKQNNMKNATFIGIDFSFADFTNADLRDANFISCNLFQAKFVGADVRRGTFRECAAKYVNLNNAHLYRTSIMDSDFLFASFQCADLGQAVITNTRIKRVSFETLLQESPSQFLSHLKFHKLTDDLIKERLENRFETLIDLYRQLRTCFLTSGYYEDASWAYYNLKQKERQFIGSLIFQPMEPEVKLRSRIISRADNFFKWFQLALLESSCGYGEQPIRVLYLSALIILLFASIDSITNVIGSAVSSQRITFLDNLIYSSGAFLTVGFPRLYPVNHLGEILTSIEGFLGILMLSLLMFVIGNRVNR